MNYLSEIIVNLTADGYQVAFSKGKVKGCLKVELQIPELPDRLRLTVTQEVSFEAVERVSFDVLKYTLEGMKNKMNWTDIQEKYPKAYDILVNSKYYDGCIGPWHQRRLYDFFDEKGIYCYPDPCVCHTPPLWGYCIMQSEKELIISESDPKTRNEMETNLFGEAFRILESTQ